MTTLSGGPRKTDFQDGEMLTASGFNEATQFWIADEVPTNEEGNDGDVVFVVGDVVGGGELPGIGGWATITEVSGTYTKHTYEDWVAYEWTADGSLTVTQGLLDVFIISSGGAGGHGVFSGAGSTAMGLVKFLAGAHPITLNPGAPNAGNTEGASIGTPGSAVVGTKGGQLGGTGGGGSGAGNWQTGTSPSPVTSSITGSAETYGAVSGIAPGYAENTSSTSGRGDGGGTVNAGGTNGTVIVRVPAANAENVTENFFRWISYATVENGVVTKVTKTPDNQPYTASADEIECDASVQEGYLYENGEFTAPEPDYSEEIEALTARLEELRNG